MPLLESDRGIAGAVHVPDLQRFECFHHLSEKALQEVSAAVRPLMLMAGETLFRQGEADGNSCYFLRTGCLAVHSKSEALMRQQKAAKLPLHGTVNPLHVSSVADDFSKNDDPEKEQDADDGNATYPEVRESSSALCINELVSSLWKEYVSIFTSKLHIVQRSRLP